MYICVQLSHIAVQQRLAQNCKSTVCVCVRELRCIQLFAAPWTAAHQLYFNQKTKRDFCLQQKNYQELNQLLPSGISIQLASCESVNR